MENIGQILKTTVELQEFSINRAKDILFACGVDYDVRVESVDYEENKITVAFEEKTNHDVPDKDWITLSLAQLEMNESDWKVYVEERQKQKLKEEEDKKVANYNKELAQKKIQFEKLKNELGY